MDKVPQQQSHGCMNSYYEDLLTVDTFIIIIIVIIIINLFATPPVIKQ